jgi:peptidoglycan/xylan/chitin deacetylase (PgdA/CDA1 family)
MYHSVGNNSAFFSVRPQDFEWQMDYLKKNGYKALFLTNLVREVESGANLNSKNIILTFDDGYEDNFLNALPVLKRYNLKATIFLATDFIGKELGSQNNAPLKMLNWEQIFEMHKSGLIDFQPHTAGHVDLAKISPAEAEGEILQSRNLLEEKLGKKCDFFAYPWGRYDSKIMDILKRNGFKSAVTVKEGVVKNGDNLFELKRNSIDSSTTREQFMGKINYSVQIFRKIFRATHS